MTKKSESTLKDLLNLPELQSDIQLRSLLESLLRALRKKGEHHLDLGDLLGVDKEHLLHHDLDFLRKLRKRIEEKIEDLLDRIACLIEKLRKHKKDKCDPLDRKKLIRLILRLIHLLNLRNLIDKLESILDKDEKKA